MVLQTGKEMSCATHVLVGISELEREEKAYVHRVRGSFVASKKLDEVLSV